MRLDSTHWTLALVTAALVALLPFPALADDDHDDDMMWIVETLNRYDDRGFWEWSSEDPCVMVQNIEDSDGKLMRRVTFSLDDVGQVETGPSRINLEMRSAKASVEDMARGETIKTTLVEIRLKTDKKRDDLEEAFDDAVERCIDGDY